MLHRPTILLSLCWTVSFACGTAFSAPPKARAVMLVDNSVYPTIQTGLQTYAAHVLREHNIRCEPRPDDYYHMQPPAIRAILKEEYRQPATAGRPPLVGAIMVGPIPHACRTHDPNEILIPSPLYYEDFEAEWVDENGDGYFEKVVTDRVNNPTEIWTAWWVPPSMDPAEQTEHLKYFLTKLDRYYRRQIDGRDQMLWTAGNVVKVEDVEGWTVLLKDTMLPLQQELRIWSKIGQDPGTFRPNKRKQEHSPRDFVTAFTLQPWQHAHIIAHGNQRGWYWDNTGVCVARRGDGSDEWSLLMDVTTFDGTAANVITTSGCSNGNFRGAYVGPAYDRALPNILLFSPHTITVAYYGAASPQSTSGFAGYCTEVVEALKSNGGSYIGQGYYKMRNQDYSWGTQHYFFRGGDEKILCGDPFARYHDSAPFSAEKQEAIQGKIDAAKWEEVNP